MLKELFTLVKTRLWRLTVGSWKKRRAYKRLAEYTATLSTDQQVWANNLQTALHRQSPDVARAIFMAEIARLSERQHRVTEALDRVIRGLDQTTAAPSHSEMKIWPERFLIEEHNFCKKELQDFYAHDSDEWRNARRDAVSKKREEFRRKWNARHGSERVD